MSSNIQRRKHAFEAIEAGDMRKLRRLVRNRVEANWARVGRGWSLLDAAVLFKCHEAARWLLDRGANPNTLFFFDEPILPAEATVDGMYFSPLASAISEGDAQLVKLMLDAGADLSLPKIVDGDERLTCMDALHEAPALMAEIERHLLSKELDRFSHSPKGGEPSRGAL